MIQTTLVIQWLKLHTFSAEEHYSASWRDEQGVSGTSWQFYKWLLTVGTGITANIFEN